MALKDRKSEGCSREGTPGTSGWVHPSVFLGSHTRHRSAPVPHFAPLQPNSPPTSVLALLFYIFFVVVVGFYFSSPPSTPGILEPGQGVPS